MRPVTTDVTDPPVTQVDFYAAGVIAIARAGCQDNFIHRFGSSVYDHRGLNEAL
jgi:hypothetical protein